MLSENVYVSKEGQNITDIEQTWSIEWTCTDCGESHTIDQDSIESFTDSDPHDPLQDYLICPNCGKSIGLFKGVSVSYKGAHATLWADGAFIYLTSNGKDIRIV